MKLFWTLFLGVFLFSPATVNAEEAIKIGDIGVYTGDPRRSHSYKNGWKMALDEINAKNGIHGQQIEVISRDDAGDPGKALRIAQELVNRDGVNIIMGFSLANVELALSEFAHKNDVVFVSSNFNSDRLIWQDGNPYSFSIAAPAMYAFNGMLAERASQDAPKKWIAINPNYEWGQANQAAFEQNLQKFNPDAVWVNKQWPPLKGYNMPSIVNAMLNVEADAIYSSLWGAHLAAFIREGQKRGLFDNKTVVAYEIAFTQTFEQFKEDTPQGWVGVGYPFSELEDPRIVEFRNNYISRFDEEPRDSSFLGYVGMHVLADAIKKAGSDNPQTLSKTLSGFTSNTLMGEQTIRAIDHKTTMGLWVGETAIIDGKPKFINWEYKDGANYMPSDNEIRRLRGED